MDGLRESVAYIRDRSAVVPRVALVLGTGVQALADAIRVHDVLEFSAIPGFPVPTLEFHRGRVLLGELDGVPVVALQGRAHRYEGHSLDSIVDPIRIVRLLGAEILVTTGACGGLDPAHELGDLVLVRDHLNLTGESALAGPNLDDLGPRFPDMSAPYDPTLAEIAREAARGLGIPLKDGVYAGVVGPQLSTRAEYAMLRTLGADVVGMSTVQEVLVARHAGMRVLTVPFVTDLCHPDALEPINVERIMRVAAEADPHIESLIRAVVRTAGSTE